MSSSEVAVSVRGLSKSYTIAHNAQKHTTAAEALVHRLRNPLQRAEKETFWALKDISFDIHQGDVVGIIGRNGAGKSTLLKILSRITEPTTGQIDLYGRVGSLLEVGTGFHPELTGRENIYLNGAIMGMKHREIERQFDAIVDFAGVEQFLDTPVKRYSSGMYVRLAFAVAAHLSSEILVVDEVLAVGDAEFQRKCLGKMKDVATSGRTVMFVSHNMDAINQLCSRAILLQRGCIHYQGDVRTCIDQYLHEGQHHLTSIWRSDRKPNTPLNIDSISVSLAGRQPFCSIAVRLKMRSHSYHKPAFVAVDILNAMGTAIMQALPSVEPFITCDDKDHEIDINVELPPLIPGTYSLTIWTGSHNTETLDMVADCASFEIVETPTKDRVFPHTSDHGYIVPVSTLNYTTNHLVGV